MKEWLVKYTLEELAAAAAAAASNRGAVTLVKRTLHLKLAPGFFIWLKSIYYCDFSLTSFTFVKLELRVQETHFYGDAGEFDERRGINLVIWSQWLYHGTDDSSPW